LIIGYQYGKGDNFARKRAKTRKLPLARETCKLALVFYLIKIMVLPQEIFLVSNGNNIVACNFARSSANDVKGQQVASGNGASGRDNNTS